MREANQSLPIMSIADRVIRALIWQRAFAAMPQDRFHLSGHAG